MQEFATLFNILNLKEQLTRRFKGSRRSSSALTTYGRQNQGRERAGRGGPVKDYSFGSVSSVSDSLDSMNTTAGGNYYAMAVSSPFSSEMVLRQDRLELTLKSLESANNELKKKLEDNDTALRDLMTVQRAETDDKLRSIQENIESSLASKLGELLAPQALSKTLSSIVNNNSVAMNARLDSQETAMNAKLESQAAALESQSVMMNSMYAMLARSLGQSQDRQTQPLVMAELAPISPSKPVLEVYCATSEPSTPLMMDKTKSNAPMVLGQGNQQVLVLGASAVKLLNSSVPVDGGVSKRVQEGGSKKEVPTLMENPIELSRKSRGEEQSEGWGESKEKINMKGSGNGPQRSGHHQASQERCHTPPSVCLTEAQFSPSEETESTSSALESCSFVRREISKDECSSVSDSDCSHGPNTRSRKYLLSGVNDNVAK